jgi:hypothetical protein
MGSKSIEITPHEPTLRRASRFAGLTVISTSCLGGGEKIHQPLDREGARLAPHQRGHVRLLDTENLAGLHRCEAALFQKSPRKKAQNYSGSIDALKRLPRLS